MYNEQSKFMYMVLTIAIYNYEDRSKAEDPKIREKYN